ncbi:MAG: hypothetical protein K1X78_15900 [Verrucomicrobiaceae bacterium]|nr:hypothetical protein [Verrucomicrobiaceae bacterium]
MKSKPAPRTSANGRASRAAKPALPKKPSTPYPGYMTDEWHEYGMAVLRSQTKEQFRADLLRFGIIDKKGNYTAPYRID